jgi:O-antigen ligase/polysaccharide polymerase Wzy-like membrane protein
MITQLNWRHLPSQIGILITFFLVPIWLKWSFAPAPFTANYVLGFLITSSMVMTIGLWIITGFVGWRNLFSSRWQVAWLILLILLAVWIVFSQTWAFGGTGTYSGLATNAGLQMLIVAGFTIVVAATAPPPRFILGLLIVLMFIHGAIGGLQVYYQSSLGLKILGELSLNPVLSGVSVIEADGLRWLRPYGLLPHPNILAGIILAGTIAAATWAIQVRKKRIFGIIAFLSGWWFLMLTFSRGAWIGFVVGGIFVVGMIFWKKGFTPSPQSPPQSIREGKLSNKMQISLGKVDAIHHVPTNQNGSVETVYWKKLIPLCIGIFILGLIFVAIYHPLLLSRVGIGQKNTELRSVADRIVFMQIAQDAIENYPMRGVGAGNFPWYASNYIFFNTDYDLRGDNVHNIYLGIWAELGIVGLLLFLGMLVSGIMAVFQQRDIERIALLAIVFAWAVIGLFDQYMWTLVMTQTLWFGLLAAGMRQENSSPPQNSI